jgi:hypothetical protein
MRAQKSSQKVGPLVCPSEDSVMAIGIGDVTAPIHPLVESATRLEFYARPVPRPLVPRSHFAVGPLPWPCGFPKTGLRRTRLTSRRSLFPSFAFLQSIPWLHLAGCAVKDNIAGTSPGLSCPSALPRTGDTLLAGLPRPLRSAFRVWLPSWRFPPPGPAPTLFHADSAPGL